MRRRLLGIIRHPKLLSAKLGDYNQAFSERFVSSTPDDDHDQGCGTELQGQACLSASGKTSWGGTSDRAVSRNSMFPAARFLVHSSIKLGMTCEKLSTGPLNLPPPFTPS